MGGTYKDENPNKEKKNPKFEVLDQKQDTNLKGLDAEKDLKKKRKKGNDKVSGDALVEEENDIVVEKGKKKKKSKGEPENDNLKKEVSVHKDGNTLEEKPKKKKSEKRAELDIIDDGGTSFAELISTDVAGPEDDGKRNMFDEASQDLKPARGIVTYPVKKKKKKHGSRPELELSPAVEIGMGGPSTWDDE
ncbi:hypothetical protein COLO4_22633 [Corchorus olitorius]|uniref:Uncharacterized protein n=1 Tax=Corchorus olitorius TaxID=93759 RepID=A0A1R3IKU7_9ROSI|nr:hypothetical protein COLO4_22633 [Corchorus olitorius]